MKKRRIKAYFYGSCDITASSTFIKKTNCVFNDFTRFGNFYSFQTDYWVSSIYGHEVVHPFVAKGVYPDKSVFDEEEKIVVFTVLCDPLLGNYIGRDGSLIRFGYPHISATKQYEKNYPNECAYYGKNVFEQFSKTYKYAGMTNVERTIDNFKIILSKFSNKHNHYIILLGPTFNSEFGEKNLLCKDIDMKLVYDQINKRMLSTFKDNNIHFIDPNKFYRKPTKKSDLFYYNFPSLIHYPRITYKKIAKEMHRLFPKTIKYDLLSDLKRFIRKKIKPKFARFFVLLRSHLKK